MLFRTGFIVALVLGSATAASNSAKQRPSDRDQVYVVGKVVTPMAINLDQPITVAQALMKAGGPLKTSRSDKVNIYRQLAKGRMTTCISMTEVGRQLGDFQLQPYDILEVTRGKCERPLCWSVNHEPAVVRIIR
jgi:hypothetical protein